MNYIKNMWTVNNEWGQIALFMRAGEVVPFRLHTCVAPRQIELNHRIGMGPEGSTDDFK